MSNPTTSPRRESFWQRLIQKRLGGYKQQINTVNTELPTQLPTSHAHSIAVIGGGIAGISAASHLAERGFRVTLFEKDAFIGGKVGSWPIQLGDQQVHVEHGFHAFFRQYYNLRNFLERLGVSQHLRPIDDYLVLAEQQQFSFKNIHTTPIYNLLSMARQGIY
ncbi:MAG: FAD-dependent oxidoreductase, partial [Myxococcota bacterium]